MNIFDAGGLVSFVALVMSLIVGIGIYMLLNNLFEIKHFGFGALISFFFGCVLAGAFIVNIIAGLLGGFLSVVWGLAKIIAIIAILGYGIILIYNKVTAKKQNKHKGDK
ncbi:hypothetical protein SAMN02745248_01175 [Hathewaya proteolytica DSM 3090]|uniref:Uncharacterized protein n=1 Tax=Hathewaya proteolytica DSM 3090 TaxID=1121331 RepID=A0A1M6MUE8_9CLOT|nr:hypothetical protein [Hathewaya proteolytica]SHJ87064.1 hypothetical protein SAMN02745248_01175 [Hathewaya proteolytica DSM 3090]